MNTNNKYSVGEFISRRSFSIYLKGFAMGVADIIPGVSGGTIAFITGIYDDLIKSVSSIDHNLVKLVLKFKIKDIFNRLNVLFLAPLAFGILSAIISTSKLVHYLLHHHAEATWSLFFGLIGASIYVIGKQVQDKFNWKNIVALFFGGVIGYTLVSLIPVATPKAHWFIFLCGMIAITAMILPGISGSFLLVILGKYTEITGALKSILKLESLVTVIVFSFGALAGLISFSKLLKYLLSNYREIALSFLTGIMLGAMKKIWPWKLVLASKQIGKKVVVTSERLTFPSEINSAVILCFFLMVVGAASVYLLDRLGDKKNQ